MNAKIAILAVVVLSIFLAGCAANQNGYSTYNNQPQQQQYVGGGCGVAPSGDYANTPVESINSAGSAPL